MKIAPLAEVKDHLSAFVEDSKRAPIIITKNGRPVAALIAIEKEEELDRLLLAYHPLLTQRMEEAYTRVKAKGGIPSDQFFRELRRRRRSNGSRTKR